MRILLGMLCVATALSAAEASSDQIRQAATRAVDLLQSSQKDWYAKQSCESCHHQIMPAIAFAVARAHGIPINETIAHDNAVHAFAPFANLDRAVQFTHIIDPSLDDGYRLVAMDAAGVRPNLTTAVYAKLIASRQRPDGHWVTIDQRPPQSYSYITATAVCVRAMQVFGHKNLASDTAQRVQRAALWLSAQHPRDTEERTFQLIGLHWAGASAKDLARLANELISTQRSDGGWNSVADRASDAYSTGEALMALHDAAGISTDSPAWQRGVRFLLDTQQPDGSWHVVSRLHPPAQVSPPYFETGYPYGHDQFVSAMGACWAIMALASASGPGHKVELPPLTEAEGESNDPWIEKVLFGSPAELRAMLEKDKFDPNSATKGGTTALMLAMPSLEKAKILLEHGADINARSKTKYSALLVAAQYPGSTPVMRYLLEKGAEIRLPKGSGAPLFNASALALAVMSGNADAVPMLIARGDKLDDKIVVIGMFESPFPQQAISFDDPATLKALLDAGSSVELPDPSGFTLLDSAIIANRVDVARLLIQRGANVNIVDQKGMTPLMYAASIDFGD
ncbi:MAG TPA: ankyrin repeat domain-containing protein, partial [Bryobacteraceae bacterium]|nr:ankyrin repeat domain-containing protein [Bryobacteraceae bacterium]